MSGGRRSAAIDLAVAGLAGVLALGVFVRSLAPGLLWGDSAEFQFAAWLGGFAHPTGYPLYLILGWLWTHLVPLRDPAFRMNLFSALWGGVAVALFSLLVMRVIRFVAATGTVEGSRTPGLSVASRLIALGAALLFTFTPTFWSQAVIAEVYTLHAAFVSGLLLALVMWAHRVVDHRTRDAGRLANVTALLFGLSLAHHRTTLLLMVPAALFVLIVAAGAHWRPRLTLRRAGLLLLCLLAPLLLYLYIPLAAPAAPYYRLPLSPTQSLTLFDSTLGGFLAHASGSVFSSALTAPRPGGLNAGGLVGRLVDELSLNGLLLGFFGLAFLVFAGARERNWRSWAVLALTGVFFLAQVAFNLFYAIGDIQVFYIPAYLVWVLWMALGGWALVRIVAWLFAGSGERVVRWATVVAGVLALVVFLAFAYRGAVEYWPKVQRAGDDSARRAWSALLDSGLPQDAVLVSNDRDEMVPLWYLAYVEGRRPDLTGLFPLIQPGASWSDVGAVLDAALQTGRPVYLVKPMPGLKVKYDLAPAPGQSVGPLGPAVRVTAAPPAAPSHPADAVYGDTVRLLGFDVAPAVLVAGQPAQVTLYWQALRETAEDWTTFVQVVDGSGEKVGQSDHHPGGAFYPTNLWRPGEQLRDTHALQISPAAGEGPYQLLVGIYRADGSGLQQLGTPQIVGQVEIQR